MHSKNPVIKYFILSWLFCASFSFAERFIPADHDLIRYSGRVDFFDPRSPSISWPGTAIEVKFTGTKVSLIVKDQYGKNYFNAFIDGDLEHPVVVDCEEGLGTYTLAEGLSRGQHSLLVTKRTEGEEGRTGFIGLVVDDDGELLPLPPVPQRKIEFFGDSITSGMGNEAALEAEDDVLAEKNNFLAYGAITARNLNAQYRSTSQSGIGIMVSWFDFVMPQFYDQLDAVGNNDSRWDFSRWTPDVVVINLFQNDSWLVEKRLDPVPSDEQRIQAYGDFLASIRGKYPDAFIICTLGSMDATKAGSKWPGYIETAVNRRVKKYNDTKLATLFFLFEGYGKHPRVQHHQKNAELLTAFIREKMNWRD